MAESQHLQVVKANRIGTLTCCNTFGCSSMPRQSWYRQPEPHEPLQKMGGHTFPKLGVFVGIPIVDVAPKLSKSFVRNWCHHVTPPGNYVTIRTCSLYFRRSLKSHCVKSKLQEKKTGCDARHHKLLISFSKTSHLSFSSEASHLDFLPFLGFLTFSGAWDAVQLISWCNDFECSNWSISLLNSQRSQRLNGGFFKTKLVVNFPSDQAEVDRGIGGQQSQVSARRYPRIETCGAPGDDETPGNLYNPKAKCWLSWSTPYDHNARSLLRPNIGCSYIKTAFQHKRINLA